MDLFAGAEPVQPQRRTRLGPGAYVLHGLAQSRAAFLWAHIQAVQQQAPLRHWLTPGGRQMSVAMTACGALGWTSSAHAYAYLPQDPLSGQAWPAMPALFMALAAEAAALAGYHGFAPDACLINCYALGARLGLHQDRDELDLDAPIVSVSLGLPAQFIWGGLLRADAVRRVPLLHGDVVVWGADSRLVHHGVAPLQAGLHALTGACRMNLTFRKVLAP